MSGYLLQSKFFGIVLSIHQSYCGNRRGNHRCNYCTLLQLAITIDVRLHNYAADDNDDDAVVFSLTRSTGSRHWTPGRTELQAGVRGLSVDDVSDDTKLIMSQLHRSEGQSEEPVVQPIVHSTIYRIKSVDHYSTVSNEVSQSTDYINNEWTLQ